MEGSRCARGIGFVLLAATASPLTGAAARAGVVDEVKGGILAHDVGIFGSGVEGGANIVGEDLFTSPGFLNIIGAAPDLRRVSQHRWSHRLRLFRHDLDCDGLATELA
jgi:hypothetical protein